VREVDPGFTVPIISHLYFALGRLEEAQRALMVSLRAAPVATPLVEVALRGWAEDGWEGSQRAIAEFFAAVEGFSPHVIAMSYALAGDADEAFAWLDEAYRRRDPLLITLKGQPSFDPIRSDPRFDDLVRRVGFPAD